MSVGISVSAAASEPGAITLVVTYQLPTLVPPDIEPHDPYHETYTGEFSGDVYAPGFEDPVATDSEVVNEFVGAPGTADLIFYLSGQGQPLVYEVSWVLSLTGYYADYQQDLLFVRDYTTSYTDNFIEGNSGIDVVFASDAGDMVKAYAGNDLLFGGSGADVFFGDSGDDTLDGGAGADYLAGGNGNDTYYVDHVDDYASESASAIDSGADRVVSAISWTLSAGHELLTLGGVQSINGTGNASNNTIQGNGGANILEGGGGTDKLIGGEGSDRYISNITSSGAVQDVIIETASAGGTDVLVLTGVSTNTTAALVQLGVNLENVTISGTHGSLLNVTGNANANYMNGNTAANVLSGASGRDTLLGGAGNDTLVGGAQLDRLEGGAGADFFDFNLVAESGASSEGRDVVLDFSRAQGDRIDLSGIDANTVTSGNQAFTFIGSAAFSADARGQLRFVHDAANGRVTLYGSIDADAQSEFSLQLNAVSSVAAADFIL